MTGVQLMDATGRIVRRYFTFFPWDVRYACAMDDTNMYLALASIGEKKLVVAKYDNDNSRGKILAEIPTGAATEPDGRWKGRWTTDVRGLALHAGRLYVPVFHDDKLAIVDTADGKLLGMADVASPRGVAAFGDGMFLLSGKKLLKLDRDGKPLATVIEAGLEDPSGLAIDADGNFYVSDRGAAQQVKVFSPAGRLIRTIGIAGGRPRNGLYNPKGLLDPRGLCVGPGGTLWVTEAAEDFQRVSVWDARTGELRKEFFNTRISSGQGRIDVARSEMVFSHGPFADVPGLAAYKIDLARGTWYPSWSRLMPQSLMQQEDVFLGNTHIYGQLATTFGGRHPYLAYTDGTLTADNGRLYAFGGEFSVWLLDPQTLEPKLAAFVYTHRRHKTQDGRFEGDYDQGPNNWLAWSDLNGDGRMAAGECVFTENHPLMEKCSRLFAWQLQKDLSILMVCVENAKPLKWHVRRLPARQVLPSGVPVYDWADLQDVVTLDVPDFKGGDGWKDPVMGAYLSGLDSAGDSIFTLAEAIAPVPIKLGGIDGDGWWASRNWRRSPMKFDAATGKPAWLKLGRRAPGKARPGQMYFPNGICATIDGFVFVPDFIAQMHVWTDTGLYVGKVYHDPNDRIMDANSIFIELVGAYAYKIDGKVYTCTGDHGVSVHEIALPKLVAVEAGTITVTPELAAAARPWDPDGPPPGKKPVYVARAICEQDPQQKKMVNTRTIEIDGKLDDWAGVQAAEIMLEGKPVATLRTVFDAENLYLAYDVKATGRTPQRRHRVAAESVRERRLRRFLHRPRLVEPETPRDANAEGDVRRDPRPDHGRRSRRLPDGVLARPQERQEPADDQQPGGHAEFRRHRPAARIEVRVPPRRRRLHARGRRAAQVTRTRSATQPAGRLRCLRRFP